MAELSHAASVRPPTMVRLRRRLHGLYRHAGYCARGWSPGPRPIGNGSTRRSIRHPRNRWGCCRIIASSRESLQILESEVTATTCAGRWSCCRRQSGCTSWGCGGRFGGVLSGLQPLRLRRTGTPDRRQRRYGGAATQMIAAQDLMIAISFAYAPEVTDAITAVAPPAGRSSRLQMVRCRCCAFGSCLRPMRRKPMASGLSRGHSSVRRWLCRWACTRQSARHSASTEGRFRAGRGPITDRWRARFDAASRLSNLHAQSRRR